jgi:16S rRNA (guanine1207-N2)-methyltransferase
MSNDLGAARFETRLEELLGTIESQSKNKCRVFWGDTTSIQQKLLDEWSSLGTPRVIPGTELESLPGLFSWNKIDQGSRLLAELMPELQGRIADIGSGYGYLAIAALKRSDKIREMELFDSDYRAIEISKINLKRTSSNAKISFHWQDIQSIQNFNGKFDAVIMNPPFHEYGTLRVELGKRFFSTAAQLLIPGGSLYAVVNRHLPYDETLWGIFPSIEQLADKYGYRVLKALT